MNKTFLLQRFFQDEFSAFTLKSIESHNLKEKNINFQTTKCF